MFKNTNILMIRHAEKPDSGKDLSPDGKLRAKDYVDYFSNYTINSTPLELNFLFASEDSKNSDRPRKTIKPFSEKKRMCINDTYADAEYGVLFDNLKKPDFDGCNILICWHHKTILEFANELLGLGKNNLPGESNWPQKWPPCVFGWTLQLSYDKHGIIIPALTFCKNQGLMPNDKGKNPPVVSCK